MCRTCGRRHNSFSEDITPTAQLQDVTFESLSSTSSIPLSTGLRSPGKISPVRGRTMKEYEEQLGNLKKENFNLKLRIYFLEERLAPTNDRRGKEELYKENAELKVEVEAMKQELYEKKGLLREAAGALSTLDSRHKEELDSVKRQHEVELEKLKDDMEKLQKNKSGTRNGDEINDLTQLCGLAFNTSFANLPSKQGIFSSNDLGLASEVSPVTGVFSLETPDSQFVPKPVSREASDVSNEAQGKIMKLEAKVKELEAQVESLEEELEHKREATAALEGDVECLRNELEEKTEKLLDMEQELNEKELKMDQVMQELETRHVEIKDKDNTIENLHNNLRMVEPEIEVKVQEIVERDRIIEEKIEQIEQQGKILVEIQITLDEKQKHIAELESNLYEAEEKVKKLDKAVDKSCKTIAAFAEEVQTRDAEISSLKRELKRKEKKVADLIAELKEALDMLNKAKWEAETSGGEDGVKEMVEEENEHLWAELEQRKMEILTVRAEQEAALQEARERLSEMAAKLARSEEDLEKIRKERTEREKDLLKDNQEKEEKVLNLQVQLKNAVRGQDNTSHCVIIEKSVEHYVQNNCLPGAEQEALLSIQNQVRASNWWTDGGSVLGQFAENTVKKYKGVLVKYREKIVSLWKQLNECQNTCVLFRNRLEELSDVLEHILEMDQRGIINLSQFSNIDVSSLHRTLDESRLLSKTLSVSVMASLESSVMDTTDLRESVGGRPAVMINLPELDDVSCSEHASELGLEDLDELCKDLDSPTELCHALAESLQSAIDEKMKGLEAAVPDEKETQVEKHTESIKALEGEVARLRKLLTENDVHINVVPEEGALSESLLDAVNCDTGEVTASSPACDKYPTTMSPVNQGLEISQPLLVVSSPSPLPYVPTAEDNCSTLVQGTDTDLELVHTCSAKAVDDATADLLVSRPSLSLQEMLAAPSCPAEHPVRISPSESESWSEPDRKVSLARIGLESSALTLAVDRSLPRPRQVPSGVTFSSESELEATYEEPSFVGVSLSTSLKPVKRKSDSSEVRRLSAKLRAVEQVNDALQAELKIYQSLSKGLSNSSIDPESLQSHLTCDNQRQSESVRIPGPSDAITNVPLVLLEEIRCLRNKLEETISNNDHLRDQLENAIACQSGEDTKMVHLTTLLQTAQEDLLQSKNKVSDLQISDELLQKQVIRYDLQVAELKDVVTKQVQLINEMTLKADELTRRLCQSENALEESDKELNDKSKALEESQTKLKEREQVIRDIYGKVAKHEHDSHASAAQQEERIKELEATLKMGEARLLQVTRDSLALVTEKTRLQAQLSSANTEILVLKEELEQFTCMAKEVEELKSSMSQHEEKEAKMCAQLDAERCLTLNLQKQLEGEKKRQSSSSLLKEVPQTGPSSPKSSASIELYHPDALHLPNWSPSKELHKSRSHRRSSRSHQKISNKENVVPSGRASVCLLEREELSGRMSIEGGDQDASTSTSGESPDLGIGSDGQFSSLEQGASNLRAMVNARKDRHLSCLCSDSSHSALVCDIKRLHEENCRLSDELSVAKSSLSEAQEQLSRFKRQKDSIGRALRKELAKTHSVLCRASGNLKNFEPAPHPPP